MLKVECCEIKYDYFVAAVSKSLVRSTKRCAAFIAIAGAGLVGTTFVQAAEDAKGAPCVSFGNFPLAIKRCYVFPSAGTSAKVAKGLHTPFPDDFPPATVIMLEDERRYPSFENRPVYMMPARNVLRVYDITAVKTAPYKTIQPQIEQLKELLARRPAAATRDGTGGGKFEELPDYPPRNAGHLVQVKMQYLDANWGRGLFYVSQFVQGLGEWPDNEQLVYLFQGLSKDERFYVSADVRITHPVLDGAKPKSDRFEDANVLTERLASRMSQASDGSFTPSLGKIRAWVSTLKID